MAKWDRRLTLVTFEIRMGSSPALSASPEKCRNDCRRVVCKRARPLSSVLYADLGLGENA